VFIEDVEADVEILSAIRFITSEVEHIVVKNVLHQMLLEIYFSTPLPSLNHHHHEIPVKIRNSSNKRLNKKL